MREKFVGAAACPADPPRRPAQVAVLMVVAPPPRRRACRRRAQGLATQPRCTRDHVDNGKRKMRKRNEKGEIVSGEKKME
jgi:hypothetical protein